MAKTKREYFTELKGIVANDKELVAFIDHELELLDKKNSAPKNPTAKQVENEKIKDIVLANIGDKAMTISEMLKGLFAGYICEDGKELSNQRLSAIVKQLVEDNAMVRTFEKRVARFSKA